MNTPAALPDLANVATVTQAITHDLSIWGLFLSADLVVKVVIIGLFAASLWSWTIIFNKGIRIKNLFASANKFEDSFWSGGSLEALFERIGNRPSDPMSAIFAAAMKEWKRSSAAGARA